MVHNMNQVISRKCLQIMPMTLSMPPSTASHSHSHLTARLTLPPVHIAWLSLTQGMKSTCRVRRACSTKVLYPWLQWDELLDLKERLQDGGSHLRILLMLILQLSSDRDHDGVTTMVAAREGVIWRWIHLGTVLTCMLQVQIMLLSLLQKITMSM